MLGADRLAPGERPARVVEAEDHADVDVLARADALADGEARLVDELGHDAPEHEARARRRPTRVRRPSAAKSASTRSAASGAVPGPRVSSTSGAPSSGGSTWKPTAPPPPSRPCSEPSAHSSATRPALQRRPLGVGAGVDQQPRDLALGLVLVARVEARPRRQRAQLVGDGDLAGDDHEPVLAAAGRRRRPGPRRARAGTRTSRARSCAPGARPPPSARSAARVASAARRS